MNEPPTYTMSQSDPPSPLPQRLLAQFLLQKSLALERTGITMSMRAGMSATKAWTLYGDAMTKMAAIVGEWHADPGITMEACFAYSRSKRHFDGPQLNMLGSAKYLLQAVAYHMELPRDAAADLMSRASMLKRLKAEALSYEVMMRQFLLLAHGTDCPYSLLDPVIAASMLTVTTVPALHRFLFSPLSIPLGKALLPEALESIRVNARPRLWAEHCGWTYADMANYYNNIIKP